MEGKKIPEYLNIHDSPQINNEELSIFTFSNNQENTNPENTFSTTINSSDKLHPNFNHKTQNPANQRQRSLVSPTRSIDKCKTYQNSLNSKNSNSLTFTPRGHQFKPNPFNSTSSEQETENNYRDLTCKLQNALHKISVSGKVLNKSSSQSTDIWQRSQLLAQRKQKQIQKKRQQTQAQKLKQLRDKPAINKYSQKIVKEIGHEPIHTRFQKIVERKKKKIEQTEQSKKRQKEQQQNLYLQELNRYMKKPSNTRTYDQYFNQMVQWKEKAEERNKQKMEEEKKKQVQGATFKPLLNTKSKKIVAEKSRLPIDQRGLIKAKTSLEFTFTPKINRKACK